MALLDQLQHLSPSSQAVLVENVSGRGRCSQTYWLDLLQCLSGSLQPKAHPTWDTSKIHSDWIEKARKTKKNGNDRILQSHL